MASKQIPARALRPDEIGRLVMIDIKGTELDAETARFIKQHGIRGVCLFRRNAKSVEQLSRLVADLREVMGEGALIAIDQEGGMVTRITFTPQAPSAMALGATDDDALSRDVGAANARALRRFGINWVFGPVLDLNSDPRNPVIGARSFGSDPVRAAALAKAWAQGSHSVGVATCVKHFPGHGDTNVDTHLAMAAVNKPLERLADEELAPFKDAIHWAPSFMTAHLLFPAIDSELPATLSTRILGGVLRQQWGYDGVVITDSLSMGAVRKTYGYGRSAVLALAAGADMVLIDGERADHLAVFAEVEKAMNEGHVSAAQLGASCARLDELARNYPAVPAVYPETQQTADEALFARVSALALTAIGAPTLPPIGSPVRLVVQRDVPSDVYSEPGLSGAEVAAVLAPWYRVETVEIEDIGDLDWAQLPADGCYTILASTSRLRYTEATARGWRPNLHIVLWNPFHVLDVDAPALVTYGFNQGILQALAACLQGNGVPQGRFPVALN
jgi:beta-N-acetylhexosaminidase